MRSRLRAWASRKRPAGGKCSGCKTCACEACETPPDALLREVSRRWRAAPSVADAERAVGQEAQRELQQALCTTRCSPHDAQGRPAGAGAAGAGLQGGCRAALPGAGAAPRTAIAGRICEAASPRGRARARKLPSGRPAGCRRRRRRPQAVPAQLPRRRLRRRCRHSPRRPVWAGRPQLSPCLTEGTITSFIMIQQWQASCCALGRPPPRPVDRRMWGPARPHRPACPRPPAG